MALVFYCKYTKEARRCVFDEYQSDAELSAIHLALEGEDVLFIDMKVGDFSLAAIQAAVDND